jgi:uncharacterized protein with gpF-like domain
MPTARYEALEALRIAYEPRYVRRLTAALYASVGPALQAAEHGASAEVCAALVQAAPLRIALEELYQRVGVSFAKAEYRALTRQRKAFAPLTTVNAWTNRLKHFLQTEAPQRLQGMVDTTRKLIADALVKAGELGLGAKEAAQLLRDHVASLTPGRALLIARTEIVAGSNYGSFIGAESTGLDLLKVWLATSDARTRDTHRTANGQAVEMKELFTVGGYPAKYPGDPQLPSAEVINCRCAISYRPKEQLS